MFELTIITINYNNVLGLENTIRSVISLDGINESIEYLIIDGNSTDGSINIIKKYTHQISFWLSEKDTGVYNAMNKGILKANGKYLLFMNSGDLIEDHKTFYESIRELRNKDIVYCDISVQLLNNDRWVKKSPDKLNLEYFYNNSLPHQSTFIKRELFIKYGLYDERIRICADWAFSCKCILLKNATYLHLNKRFSLFMADGGLSSNAQNEDIMKIEKKNFIIENFHPFGKLYCSFFKLKNYIYRLLIAKK